MSKLEVYWLLLKIVVNALWRTPDLLYYSLPRSWRGGYLSPWKMRQENPEA